MLIFGWNLQAIIGMFFQDGLTGSAWGDWSLYTTSPLRAGREPRIARNFFGGDSLAMPASTLRRNLVCRILSDFGTRLAWARTRMRQPSSAVVLWRSSTAALSGSGFWRAFTGCEKEGNRKHFPRRGAVQSRSFRQGGARARFNAFPISVMSRRFAWGHVCNHWLHRSGILQVPRIPFAISWLKFADVPNGLAALSSQVLTCKPRARRVPYNFWVPASLQM